jgi:hypothetical protein
MARVSTATLCEALFASDLQPSQHPQPHQVRAAIRHSLMTLGARDCATSVAQEYGDHPDIAFTRMRWAQAAVSEAYRRGTGDRIDVPRPYSRSTVGAYRLVPAGS